MCSSDLLAATPAIQSIIVIMMLRIKSAIHTSSEAAYTPSRSNPAAPAGDGFMNIPDGVEDEGLPFN